MNDTSCIDTILMGLGLFSRPGGSMSIGATFVLISSLLSIIAHIAFALGVYIDGKRMMQQRTGPFLAGPFIWALLVFVGGPYLIAIYWLIHYSTLRQQPASESDQNTKPVSVAPPRGSDPVY